MSQDGPHFSHLAEWGSRSLRKLSQNNFSATRLAPCLVSRPAEAQCWAQKVAHRKSESDIDRVMIKCACVCTLDRTLVWHARVRVCVCIVTYLSSLLQAPLFSGPTISGLRALGERPIKSNPIQSNRIESHSRPQFGAAPPGDKRPAAAQFASVQFA